MTEIIILNNKYCRINSDNNAFLKSLRKHLSYKIQGIEYTPSYKSGYWDGINYLMNNNVFALGLLNKAIEFCKKNNINPTITDKRIIPEKNDELDISKKLISIGKTPRDYQVRALEAAVNNNMGIIRGCTGCGKTLISCLITAKFNKPTIIYVIGLSLLQQFHQTFSEIFDEKIGFVGNGICDIQRINIVSIWTVGRALNISPKKIIEDSEEEEDESFEESAKEKIINMLKAAKIHILDECHTATTNTIKEIHKSINPERIYGMSGTPYREDGSELLATSILGEKIIDISAHELIEKKVLAQPVIKYVSSPVFDSYGKTYQEIYTNYIVENKERNNLILEETKKLVEKGYQTLVLFKMIKHGDILFDLFKSNNVECEILSGKDSLDRREEVKKKLLKKELMVVLSSTILEIGFDCPTLSGLVIARGGKSKLRLIQVIGRIIRSDGSKTRAAAVDFYDNVKYLKEHSKKRQKTLMEEKGFKVIGYKI